MGAVETNTLEVINFLLNKKSNISIKDNDNNTLVYYLIESYDEKDPNIFNKKLIKLLDKGLKINKNQSKGQTLWHLAVKKNNLQLLKQISSFNNFLNQKNEEGLTPIHLAAMKATDTKILKFLMEKGADITIKTDYDESVFDLAYENELLQKQNKNLNFLK
jgi:ankyrin repeat protein